MLIALGAVGLEQKLSAAAPLPAKTLWAAVRKDGIVGTGTMRDPFDASTESKFDAILANISAANGAQRVILHLGPGIFTITPIQQLPTSSNPGGYVSNIPGNFEIIGAGEAKTTIRAGMVSAGNATYWMLAQIGPVPGDFFENLTIDCNIQNQTASNLTIDGIEFLNFGGPATHSLAANIHVINGGNRSGDPGYSEWFGIAMNDATPGTNAEATHCRIDTYQGNAGCTAIAASTSITDNVVILNNNDPDDLLRQGNRGGFQNAFSPAGTVYGNVCHQCTWGIYCDVDNQGNENIEHNVFDALYGGVWIYNWSANATITNVAVHNNTIVKTYIAAVVLGSAATSVVNSNLSVYDNVVETVVNPTLQTNDLVYLTAAENSEVYGNTFSVLPAPKVALPIVISFPDCNLGTIAWYGNKYNTGAIIPGPAGTVAHALSAP